MNRTKIYTVITISLILIALLPIPSFLAYKISLTDKVSYYYGRKPIRTIQYLRYELLKRTTNKDKLLAYSLSHSNSAVRCYSFLALITRNEKVEYLDLIESSIKSDKNVLEEILSRQNRIHIGDFFIDKGRRMLSKSDSLILDSLLLFSNTPLNSKEILLSRLKPKDTYYNQIKKLATENKEGSAIIALARFQKKEDIKILEEYLKDSTANLQNTLKAVSVFPDSSLLPNLQRIHDKLSRNHNQLNPNTLRIFYKALLKYKSPNIHSKLLELITIDKVLRKVPIADSLGIGKFYNLQDYTNEHAHSVHSNIIALKVAIITEDDSLYSTLENKMDLTSYELEMIKLESEKYSNELISP